MMSTEFGKRACRQAWFNLVLSEMGICKAELMCTWQGL